MIMYCFRQERLPVFAKAATGFAFSKATKRILAMITPETKVRYNKEYFRLPEVQKRFFTYYNACLAEVEQLGKFHEIQIPQPLGDMIFGHTHVPITMDNPIIIDSASGTSVSLCNTGGWLWKQTRDKKNSAHASSFQIGIRQRDLWPLSNLH